MMLIQQRKNWKVLKDFWQHFGKRYKLLSSIVWKKKNLSLLKQYVSIFLLVMILYSNNTLNSELITVVIKEKIKSPLATSKVMKEICQCSQQSVLWSPCLSACMYWPLLGKVWSLVRSLKSSYCALPQFYF